MMEAIKGVNRVVVVGVVEANPRGRRTAHGTWMAKVQVRTYFGWTDRETGRARQEVEVHQVVVFGADAQRVMQEVSKGDIVSFEGRLRTSNWTDNAGQPRTTTEIVSEWAQLVAGSRDSLGAGMHRGAR